MASQARIIIIGGGIVGVSTLYHLARAGERDVLLLERRELTSGATWHAAGNVHTQSAYANLSALQAYSLRLYDGLAEEVGQTVDSHVVGGFFLAQTGERMEEFKHLAGKFRGLGLEYELVTPEEIKAKYPMMRVDDLKGGAWDPEEGYVDPYSVTMGLAAGARMYGGTIRRNCQVEAIRRLPSGHWQLDSADEQFECEVLLNAAGFWADDVARMVGTRLPVTNMEHHYLVTETMPEVAEYHEELPMIRDTDSQYYLRQEGQGLLLGPWERDCRAAWDNAPAPWDFGQELFENDLGRLEEGLAAIYHRIPCLETAGIKRVVNGAISFAPDGRPMIGPMPGVPNFFVACGFLGGIAQAGGIGLAMSQWILGGEPELDLHFIDVARFGDWTTREFARERTYEIFPRRYEIIYPHAERESGRPLKTTPIYSDLLARGAVMGQTYGWERPLWYAQQGVEPRDEPSFGRPNWWEPVRDEALAMTRACALSEMSTYGKFRVRGPDAAAFLDHVGSASVPAEDGRIVVSLLLNERGGIVGDLTVTRLGSNHFYLVGATLGVAVYARWLTRHADGFDVDVDDITDTYAAFGLAGPASRELLTELAGDVIRDLRFMRHASVEIGRIRCEVLRVSYSGELGYELHCPMTAQKPLFDTLMAAGTRHGLTLMGSRAMGMLRLEKGYRSWGTEMTTEVSPHAAGLERFCATGKPYIGSEAVARERTEPPVRRLATLIVDKSAPPCWGTEPILDGEDVIGYVTSGGMGWRTGQALAVAWMDSARTAPGTQLDVQVLLKRYAATVAADPVYDPQNRILRG